MERHLRSATRDVTLVSALLLVVLVYVGFYLWLFDRSTAVGLALVVAHGAVVIAVVGAGTLRATRHSDSAATETAAASPCSVTDLHSAQHRQGRISSSAART